MGLTSIEVKLQPKRHSARNKIVDPVTGWMELMAEWDALAAALDNARARAAGEGEAAILEQMHDLEKRISAFLGMAARARQPIDGPLVVGTLVSHKRDPTAESFWASSGKKGH